MEKTFVSNAYSKTDITSAFMKRMRKVKEEFEMKRKAFNPFYGTMGAIVK